MIGTLKKMEQEYNKLQQQNLRELVRLTFLNLMSANGVMAKTIIRNYKQRQQRESYDNLRQCENIISKS
jgi:hypothetical protein